MRLSQKKNMYICDVMFLKCRDTILFVELKLHLLHILTNVET